MTQRSKSRARLTIAIILSLIMTSMVIVLFIKAIPEQNKDAFNILLGFIGGAFVTMISFFFGDSEGKNNP